jgi:hypothetical protein
MAADPGNAPAHGGQSARVGAAVGTATAGVGAAVTATLASVCCAGPVVAPIVVGLLGATGAATAAGLKPYTPYLFAISLAMLAIGFRSVYRARRSCTVGGSTRALDISIKISQAVLWTAAALWVASVIFTVYSLNAS